MSTLGEVRACEKSPERELLELSGQAKGNVCSSQGSVSSFTKGWGPGGAKNGDLFSGLASGERRAASGERSVLKRVARGERRRRAAKRVARGKRRAASG